MCKPKLKISLEIQKMQKIFDKAQKQIDVVSLLPKIISMQIPWSDLIENI